MAVTLKGQTAVYEGTSTDTKPTDADNNAIFKELDTGIRYYYDGTDWNEIPRSGGGGGGGTGTDNYNDLNNKPSINGTTLSGNKSLDNLGIQAKLTFDSAPTEGSENPVESGGVYSALAGKQDAISDLSTIRSGAAAGATAVQPADLATALATKQDTISDLNTIRSGAAAGATAVQPAAMSAALATKQDTLSSAQLAAVNSGIDSTKAAQIETNKNNISKDEAALVELVDGGAKNLWDFKNALYSGKSADASYTKTDTDITVTSNGAWSSVTYRVIGLKTGQRYIWSVRISDYSVQSDTCRLRISSDAASQRPIAVQMIEGNGNVYVEFVGQPELYFAYYINFNATSYQNTYKASENMICTKAEWDISQTYQPYRPSYQELYERVVALEQANQ